MKRRPKPKQYDLELAHRWWIAVTKRATCALCTAPNGLQAHHAVPKTHVESFVRSARLSNDERNHLIWDIRNGIPLCIPCHEGHTSAAQPLTRKRIPAAAWEYAGELDKRAADVQGFGPAWATARLEREYPLP